MFITQIQIYRDGYLSGYTTPDQSKPFSAKVEVAGVRGKTELLLSPELSRRVIEIIADELMAATRATAEAMTAEVLSVAALPSPAKK